jgi:hypothetical protein
MTKTLALWAVLPLPVLVYTWISTFGFLLVPDPLYRTEPHKTCALDKFGLDACTPTPFGEFVRSLGSDGRLRFPTLQDRKVLSETWNGLRKLDRGSFRGPLQIYLGVILGYVLLFGGLTLSLLRRVSFGPKRLTLGLAVLNVLLPLLVASFASQRLSQSIHSTFPDDYVLSFPCGGDGCTIYTDTAFPPTLIAFWNVYESVHWTPFATLPCTTFFTLSALLSIGLFLEWSKRVRREHEESSAASVSLIEPTAPDEEMG